MYTSRALLFLFTLGAALASSKHREPIPRELVTYSFRLPLGRSIPPELSLSSLTRRDDCGAAEIECGNGCMDITDTCCPNETSCRLGETCTDSGCECDSAFGDCSDNSDGTGCRDDEETCGSGCMPLGDTCCENAGLYCPAHNSCTSDNRCKPDSAAAGLRPLDVKYYVAALVLLSCYFGGI